MINHIPSLMTYGQGIIPCCCHTFSEEIQSFCTSAHIEFSLCFIAGYPAEEVFNTCRRFGQRHAASLFCLLSNRMLVFKTYFLHFGYKFPSFIELTHVHCECHTKQLSTAFLKTKKASKTLTFVKKRVKETLSTVGRQVYP